MQLDVEDIRTIGHYKRKDHSFELLKVPSPLFHHHRVAYYSDTYHHHHYQAETMHKMVETIEYDGEPFSQYFPES